MSRTLWNEGRVVGLSAYEIFVRHVLAKDSSATVPSEVEWLTSMMANGSAMLLKIDANDSASQIVGSHYIDVELPSNSILWGTNTLIGSCFIGEGGGATANTNSWCTKVISYGPLIQNDSTASPTDATTTIPPTTASGVTLTDDQKAQLAEYAKIVDGIAYQPGTWSTNSSAPPQKTEVPDTSKPAHVRILLNDKVDITFYVLITGFSYKGVFDSIADYTSQGSKPENGDFLGPVAFPWSSKILFVSPVASNSPAEIDVIDLANLYIYNTKYLWFYKLGDAQYPTQAELSDVRKLNGVQVVAGYLSQQFIDTYCVSASTAVSACAYGKISSETHADPYDMPQLWYVKQIHNNAALDINDYKFFYQKQTSVIDAPGKQGMFWPVELSTGRIIMTLSNAENSPPEMVADRGFNFSMSDVTEGSITIPKAKTDIMGSIYGVEDLDPNNNEMGECDTVDLGVYVFGGTTPKYHPIQRYAIKEYNLFGKPNAAVPLPPQQYGFDFTSWLSATPIKNVLCGDDTATADTIFDTMGIHADFRDIDALSFLQYAATERDLRLPLSTDYTSETSYKTFYLFTKATIEAIDSQADWTGHTYTATERFRAAFSKSEFFKPAKMIALDQNGNDITRQFTDSGYHLWGTETKVGREETIALSLTDDFGALLPMGGTQGTLSGDTLNWDLISASLSQNKAIDLLGDGLRAMKASKDNYIKMGNGLRLYISSTEPTDTDVPEGSVGLGWNGVKIYTSGAWT